MHLRRSLRLPLLAGVAGFLGLVVWGLRVSPPNVRLVGVGTSTIAPETSTGIGRPQGCAYVWAHRNLPDLSRSLESRLAAYADVSSARAEAFGEECAGADTIALLALETDYYVSIRVQDLEEQATMGRWIRAVMAAVESLPVDSIPGAQLGFVEFRFVAGTDAFLVVRVGITEFRATSAALTDSALFVRFSEPLP